MTTATKKVAKKAAKKKPGATPPAPGVEFSAQEKPPQPSPVPSGLAEVGKHSLIIGSSTVRLADLRMYYRNPRVGDVEGIAESLKSNLQYRRIVVNKGTKTGRHNEILAGNHTYLGARRLGWETMDVDWVDVDDVQAAKIVAVDNRMNDKGSYDDRILASLLRDLPDVEGTGFSPDEVQKIIDEFPVEDLDELSKSTEAITAEYDDDRQNEESRNTFEGSPLGEEPDDIDDGHPARVRRDVDAGEAAEEEVDTTGSGDEIGEQEEDLPGARALKDPLDMDFGKPQTWWELPRLRADRFLELSDLPPEGNLYAWCGPITKTWIECDLDDAWWFYQWGVDGTSAMPDISKVIVGFYAFDDRFENWWWYPSRYMAKVLNSGIKFMCMPDFSEDHPRVEAMWSLYRSLYLARYFQECGIKVCPNLSWLDRDEEFLTKIVLPSLPKNAPLMSIQLQTWREQTEEEKEGVRLAMKHLQFALDELQPQALLFYHGRQAKNIFTDGTIKYPGKVYYVRSRTDMIAEWQEKTGQRKQKKTI